MKLTVGRCIEYPATLLLVVPVSAWYSLSSLIPAAGLDTPVAYAAVAPFLAAYLLIHELHRAAAPKEQSDPFVDGLVFLALALLSLLTVFYLPQLFSWYYWLARLDMLVIPGFLVAVITLLWGLGAVRIMWRVPAYLLLALPWTVMTVHQSLAPFLVWVSRIAGLLAARGLSLPVQIPEDDLSQFVAANGMTIIISDTCSGSNALMGFLLTGLPLALTWSGNRGSKLAWLCVGAALAFAGNLMRVVVLLYVGATPGLEPAFDILHPYLGAILFTITFVIMLGLAPRFGLAFRAPESDAGGLRQMDVVPQGLRFRAIVAVLVALILAAGQVGLTRFDKISAESLPAASVQEPWDVLPDLPGWSRDTGEDIDWKNLYGPRSRSRVLTYTSGGQSVVVQVVATPDGESLAQYTPEQCTLFHGEQISGVSTVRLGNGVFGRLVKSDIPRQGDAGPLPSAALYWQLPARVGNDMFHVRVMLLADVEMLATGPQLRAADSGSSSDGSARPVLHGEPGTRAELDLFIEEVAREMVSQMIAQMLGSGLS